MQHTEVVLWSVWPVLPTIYKHNYIGLDTQNFCVKLLIFSYPSVLKYVLGAQKNLIETVLLSTHNICFG